MADLTLTILPNGPLRLEGPVRVLDSRGNEMTIVKPQIFLCRCGLSKSKPFCDGSHKAANFQGLEAHLVAAEAAGSADKA